MESAAHLTKDYSKDTNKAILSKIQSFLKENDVSNGKISVRSLYLADGEKTFSKRKDISCSITLPVEKKDKATALRKKLAEDPELGEIIEIECSVGVGDQFQPIEGADRPEIGGEENLTISHTEGTVLLVDFWATWCGPCQQPMAHNQEMLEKNEEKWKDKVRIVGASLDKDRNQLLTRIKEKGWNRVDHYILPGNWKHPAPQTYGCNGIPHVILVNKVGTIVYKGHPSSTDLEEEINKLLAEEPKKTEASKTDEKSESGAEKKKEEKGVPLETYKRLRSLIKEGKLRPVTELNGQKGYFQVYAVLQHTKELDVDLKVIETNRGKLMAGGAMTSNAAEIFKKNLAAATEGIAEEHITERIQILDTVKIEFGSSCNSCSKALTNQDAQYFSYQDKAYFCKACGEHEDPTKIGVEKYVNSHALIYLHLKDPSGIEEVFKHRISDQMQPKTKEEEEKLKIQVNVACDACGETLQDIIRYKCLNCEWVDICRVCHEKAEGGDSTVVEKLKSRGHDTNTHILQRFCFTDDTPY